MADVITVISNNSVSVEVPGSDVIVAMATAATAENADRAEAALAEIEDIAAGAPDAPSVVNKLNRDGDNAATDLLTNLGVYSISESNAATDAAIGTAVDDLIGDLSLNGGASMIGSSTGLTVEQRLTALENAGAFEYARAHPPGEIVGQDYYSVWPTADDPMAAIRMTEFMYMVRILRTNGFVEEMVYVNPNGYAGVDGGHQLWAHRAFAKGKVKNNLLQPPMISGTVTTTEWAFRLGLTTDSYPSAYLDGEINGFGHGNMTLFPGSQDIRVDGVGANMVSLTNWPIGDIITGDHLVLIAELRLALHSTATEAASAEMSIILDKDYGIREITGVTALIADLAFQDSPTAMHATNFGDPYGYDMAKMAGETAIPLTGSNEQKGNWKTITTGTAQYYRAADPTIVYYMRSGKGPAIQNQAETLTPYQYCAAGTNRGIVLDNATMAKFALFATTAPELPPKFGTPLPLGDKHTIYNFRSTEDMPGGPT